MILRPPPSTFFPYTTLFRSSVVYSGSHPASFYTGGTAHLDGLPVDFLAAAIGAIAASPSDGYAVYHLNNVHWDDGMRSEEHTSELQSQFHLVCRLLLEKKKK